MCGENKQILQINLLLRLALQIIAGKFAIKLLSMLPLSVLQKGQEATIVQINDDTHAIQLMEMGFVPGQRVKIDNVAPLGDPIAVQIAGYKLSIRKEDAAHILVEALN